MGCVVVSVVVLVTGVVVIGQVSVGLLLMVVVGVVGAMVGCLGEC